MTTGTVAVLCAALAACASSTPDSPPPTPSYSASSLASTSSSASPTTVPVANSCGASELAKLSVRQKLAQLIVVGVTGAADAQQIVENEEIGGIFVGSWTDKAILTSGAAARISQNSPIPLMVTVDQEGGRVSRLSALGIDHASPRELAQTRTPEQVRAIAADVGRKLKRLGVTVDFAPVADVSDESDNEVIGDRSFSNDPAVVTEYAGAYAAGLADAGITPVYKHFPGHGHGSGDSHLGIVTVPSLAELQDSDLVPFRTLLRDPGTAGAMVGHLIVPGLTKGLPASISRPAIQMLRTGVGYDGPRFNGVIYSDDLSGMAAINAQYPIEQAVEKFILAGGDIALWLSTDRVSSVLDNLERAVSAGRLAPARLDDKVVRILRSKGVVNC
ncbi:MULTISPECIES: glycoside hydrolase family 3 N-terminal domain-containing protein [unclassified Gordonia (in: high G+C Gram-positive bacteria)]|uniref:glycoside hydrolase family 3 N-terminal domain-containing protein n=1 Tax=unclassified Gordonia (in: high G+C Gram-positive bacteria) TaxID=2657482 RepID=UPI0010F54992|nr:MULTISPECIES: glycoside hydrolase family 3 N-terminal domain-containing protein [unclassified Gordonia (in: high G+C Gram-positive bacteria)]MBN0972201.1 glycoside hydrolase family 3 protein [Gordonia sp. BP-119]MBN0984499.1 glycoside hydrolase family 3 protein [Gordonia sp. BP-94]